MESEADLCQGISSSMLRPCSILRPAFLLIVKIKAEREGKKGGGPKGVWVIF